MSRAKKGETEEAPKTASITVTETVSLALPLVEDCRPSMFGDYAYHQVATLDELRTLVRAAEDQFGRDVVAPIALSGGRVTVSRKRAAP